MSDKPVDNTDASPEGRGSGDGTGSAAPAAPVQTGADVPAPREADLDSLDARNFARLSIHSDEPSAVRAASVPDPDYVYKMDYPKRGIFIVVNNKTFDSATGMNSRTGTDQDAANLYTQFKKLGFEVHLYNNLRADEMMKLVIEVSKLDHSDNDMFAMAILSHGDEGMVYGTDGIIQLDRLFAPIKGDKCKTLIGKPKFMIIQACRGSQLDHGVETTDAERDEEPRKYRIPTEADFLYAYSTTPGFFSWRNSTKGSWFVQALTQVLNEYGQTREIMWLLTRANYLVAYEFQSNASKEFMNKKKQIPSIVSQLTKELYLTQKSK